MSLRVGLFLPTLNAALWLPRWIEGVRQQTVQPDRILVIDSSSEDNTVALCLQAGFEVHTISRQAFSHGGTRMEAINRLGTCDIVICMTQDALLDDPSSFSHLIAVFDDPIIAAAYGRQLPHQDADPLAKQARQFNYPAEGHVSDATALRTRGLRAAFCSNSYAAWRRSSLIAIGGFDALLPFAEDMYASATLLTRGWSVAYCANATVRHSHNYGIREDFQRYWLTGYTHRLHPWILTIAGGATSEGMKLLRHRLAYLRRVGMLACMHGIMRTAIGWIAYKLGRAGILSRWLAA
ncbi:glycosyltransferase [Burkholderiaceae bacterium DAT-1]|nr:glycosyltransferase [Burkholderiaceae bacterium DAT-1]